MANGKDKIKYDNEHVYSSEAEAKTKYAIDLQFIGGDYSKGREVNIDNEKYLKFLIEKGSIAKHKVSVGTKGKMESLQFFIISGGAEGFLPTWLSGQKAGNFVTPGSTTAGAKSLEFHFDHNDLLAVFDGNGTLISSARLERPLFIEGVWSQKTADRVYNSWDSKEVFIYKNTSFDIPYLGIGVRDGFRGRKATVDMHKQEATNGCIFIVDPNTPSTDNSNIGKFEPYLILKILGSIGKKAEDIGGKPVSLGVIHMVKIR